MTTTRRADDSTRRRFLRLLSLSVPTVIALTAIAACAQPPLSGLDAVLLEAALLAPLAWFLAQFVVGPALFGL